MCFAVIYRYGAKFAGYPLAIIYLYFFTTFYIPINTKIPNHYGWEFSILNKYFLVVLCVTTFLIHYQNGWNFYLFFCCSFIAFS